MLERNSKIISSVDDVLEDAYKGKMFIIVDGKERENEGDLVVLAEKVNPDALTMMINNGSGIVCLTITESYKNRLSLDFMPKSNVDSSYTAFTTSIDARYGITTGVSSYDRTRTVLTAIDENCTKDDLVTPGHVFPIVAQSGGVLSRPGHTEASVEIARLSNSNVHAAVICELMNNDGTMCRMSDIEKFSLLNNIKVVTVEMIIDYIRYHKLVI